MSLRAYAFVPFAVAVFAGCPKDAPQPAPSGTSTTATTAPTATEPAPTASAPAPAEPATTTPWVGAWKNAACGERKYVRHVSFAADGTVKGSDHISPCPKGAACVWSGIVNWSGTYEAKDGQLAVQVKIEGGPKGELVLPTAFSYSEEHKAVVEPNDGSPCVYEGGGQ